MPKPARKVKAYLIIKDHVQDVGYRVWIMERILETNLQGGPINQPDGSIKVLLEGTRKEILEFVERLKQEKPELAENPVMVGPTFVAGLSIPEKMVLTHALQMNQFGKAIVYLDGMKTNLDELKISNNNINNSINTGIGMLSDRISQAMLVYPVVVLIIIVLVVKIL